LINKISHSKIGFVLKTVAIFLVGLVSYIQAEAQRSNNPIAPFFKHHNQF